MAKVSNELVTNFVFQGSLAPLQSFNLHTGGAITKIGLFAGAMVGFAGTMGKWVTGISAGQDAVGQLSRSIGVSVEALGELGYAASQNGSSLQAVQTSFKNLARRIGETAALGKGEGVKAFNRLGISVRDAAGKVKTADVIFEDFRASVVRLKLSASEVQGLGEKLGIDSTLVQTLMLSGEAMNDLRAKAIAFGRTTTEQSDQMLAYNDSIGSLKKAFEGLKVRLAVSLIPQLKELAELFTGKIMSMADGTAKVFKNLADVFEVVFRSMVRMAPVALGLAFAVGVLKLATIGLTGVLKALGKIAIVAALLAVYLIVDDLVTAFQGGQSVIADFYSGLTGGRSVIDDMGAALDVIGTGLGILLGLFVALKAQAALTATMVGVKAAGAFALAAGKVVLLNLALLANPVGLAVAAFAVGAALIIKNWEPVRDFFLGLWENIKSIAGSIGSVIGSVLKFAGGSVAVTAPSPSTQSMVGSTSNTANTSNVQQNVKIEVRSTDPVVAGQAAGDAIKSELKNAQLQSGVRAR